MVKKRERAVITPPSSAAVLDEQLPQTKPKPRAKKKVDPAPPPEPKEDDDEVIMDTFLIQKFEHIQIPRPKNPKPEDYFPPIRHDPEPNIQPNVEQKIAAFGDQA